jgi:uncharacterized protein (TIGR02452 family)
MGERVRKVLTIAAEKGHEAIILGAWGCGVFGNDPKEIAQLFREALTEAFRGVFVRVVFAVLDSSEETQIIGSFRNAFGSPLPGTST